MYKYIFPALVITMLGAGCYMETKPVSSIEQQSMAGTGDQSAEKVIYNILNMEQRNSVFYATVASSTMASGDAAVNLAVKETGCAVEKITYGDCAPSLNNGFYISKKFSKKMTLALTKDVQILILQGVSPVQRSAQDLLNVVAQTNAISPGENRTPFIIRVNEGSIDRIEQIYIP